MARAKRDDNFIPALLAENDSSGIAEAILKDNATGGLYVHVVGNDVASGGTSTTDDGAFTAGSGSGTPIMGFATSDAVDAGDVGVLAMDVNRNLKVSIEADNAGIGGGIQYTEGDTDASITGTAIMMEGAGNALVAAPGTATDGLLVNLGANNDITGTVTANLGATDNAVLDAIEADTTTIAGAVSGTEMQVDVLTSALPTGASTSAKQDTIIGHVDGIETVLGTIDTDTGAIATSVASIDTKTPALGQALAAASVPVVLTAAQITTLTPVSTVTANAGTNLNTSALALEATATSIKTAVETIDNAISGTEMQVDVLTMPTTTVQATNLDIRDLSSASDTITVHGDVGVVDQLDLTNSNPAAVAIVDGNGDQITSFGGGTQYTEGDTDASITGTALMFEGAADGLVAAPGTAANGLDVDVTRVSGTVTVDGSGVTQPISHAALTELAAAINSDKVDVNIVSGSAAGTEYTEDAAAVANPAGGALIYVREDARAGNLTTTDGDNVAARGNNKGELYVKTTDSDALLTTIDGDTSNISTKIDTVAGAVTGTEMQVDIVSAPTLTVNAHAVTNAGTFVTQENGALLTAAQLIDDTVYVDDADWTDSTSKHSLVGGLYQSTPQTVTDGDVAPFNITANGALHVSDAGGSLTVDGSVTANAGTNLNTSALALETGGNLAAAATSLGSLDNSVDGNYLNVNMNVAGTDVVSGSGTATGALRVEIANNGTGLVGLNAGSNAIGKLAANSGVDIGDVTLTAGTAAIGSLLPPDIDVTTHTNYARKYYTSAGAATDGIIWSPAAGKRWHVLWLYFQLSADATVTLEDDKAGGDDPVLKGEFKAGSGIIGPFPEKYPLASGEDAADLTITTSAGNCYVTCVGYEV